MFRNFIYLNEDKMFSYKSMIDKSSASTKTISRTKTKTLGTGDQLPLKAQFSDKKTYTEEENYDPAFVYDEFERLLNDHSEDDYFDFVFGGNYYDFSTLPPMSIIRIKGCFEIPESFDMINVIEKYKPLLIQRYGEQENGDLLKNLLENSKADIPIIIDTGDIVISGKLNTENLNEDYASLEDYEEQEVFFLCKVEGFDKREKVAIYDPAKDFIKLNRAMRRTTDFGNNENMYPIIIDGPVLKVEVIAIYK